MEYLALFKVHELITAFFLLEFGFMGVVAFAGILNLVKLDREIRAHYVVRMTVFGIFYKRFLKQKEIRLSDEKKRKEKKQKFLEEAEIAEKEYKEKEDTVKAERAAEISEF